MSSLEDLIRVVLVDDQFDIHRIVKEIISTTDDIRLVGQCANGQEAIELCEYVEPDIVLMDVVMPMMDGIEATKALKDLEPDIKILVLSSYQDHENVYAMLQNGAVGYITKSSLAEDLAATIRAAHHGKLVFSSEVAEHLMKAPRPADDFQLTEREMEVLERMAEGLTNQQAALQLEISQSTLKYHVKNICVKLGVETRSEALVIAAKNNLI